MSGKAKSRDLSFSRAGLYDPFRGLLTSLAEIFLPQGAMSVLGVVLTDKNPGAKPSTLQPLGPMWLHQGHAWGLPQDSGVALFLKKAAVASAIAARFCTQQSKVVCPILHLSQLLKVKRQRSSSPLCAQSYASSEEGKTLTSLSIGSSSNISLKNHKMSQSCPHTAGTGREGSKSTNFLVPQVSSVICPASLLAQRLTWAPGMVCGWLMHASCHLSWLPMWQTCQCLHPMSLPWHGLWVLTWHQEAALASQQRPGFSLTSLARHSGALNSQKCLVAPGLMLTSRSSPRKYPLAPECLVLRFLINHLCLEGKPSKRESEKDHFEFEVGKNKDNSLQNVEISSHIKETFDLCPSYANALLSWCFLSFLYLLKNPIFHINRELHSW